MKIIVIFICLLVISLISCNAQGEKEILVIPKNYKGYILIIYNQKNGIPAKYLNKKRLYEIPENGILRTQFIRNKGWIEIAEFYYVDIVPENKLTSFVEIEKVPLDTIVGFIGSNGRANKDYEGKEVVEYSLYYIGTKSDIEQAIEQVEKLDKVKLAE